MPPGCSAAAAVSSGPRPRGCGLVLIVASLLLTGCAAMTRDLQPPGVSLAAVELAEMGLRSQRFRLTLELDNPNTVALPVRRLDYDVLLAGQRLASGYSEEAFRVPAGGRERITLLVSTDLLSSADRLFALFQRGDRTVDYDVSGRVRLDLPLTPSLRYSDRGEVQLQR